MPSFLVLLQIKDINKAKVDASLGSSEPQELGCTDSWQCGCVIDFGIDLVSIWLWNVTYHNMLEWYLVCIGYPVVFVTRSQVLLVLLTLADSNARMFKDTLLRAGLKAVGSLWDMKSGLRIRKKLEQLGLTLYNWQRVHCQGAWFGTRHCWCVQAQVAQRSTCHISHMIFEWWGWEGASKILGLSLKAGQMRCSQRHCCMALCNLLHVSNYDDNWVSM